jgi:hypothetical protein
LIELSGGEIQIARHALLRHPAPLPDALVATR